MLHSLVSLSGVRPLETCGTVQDSADSLIETKGRVIRNNPLMRILKTKTFNFYKTLIMIQICKMMI